MFRKLSPAHTLLPSLSLVFGLDAAAGGEKGAGGTGATGGGGARPCALRLHNPTDRAMIVVLRGRAQPPPAARAGAPQRPALALLDARTGAPVCWLAEGEGAGEGAVELRVRVGSSDVLALLDDNDTAAEAGGAGAGDGKGEGENGDAFVASRQLGVANLRCVLRGGGGGGGGAGAGAVVVRVACEARPHPALLEERAGAPLGARAAGAGVAMATRIVVAA
jgi:hypothetical protein